MTRLGLLSDIHGNDAALSVVLSEFRRQGLEHLLFLGDMVGYYPFTSECVQMLAGFDVQSVRGNHDQVALDCVLSGTSPSPSYRDAYGTALDRTLAADDPAVWRFLQAAELRRTIVVDHTALLLSHGSPWDALEGRVYPDFHDWQRFDDVVEDVCLLGHTHYPLQHDCGHTLVLNPGSVGQARHRSGVACCAVLEIAEGRVSAILLELPYDASRVIKDARLLNPTQPYISHVLER